MHFLENIRYLVKFNNRVVYTIKKIDFYDANRLNLRIRLHSGKYITMNNKIKEFLEKCPKLWRARNIKKYPEYLEFLNNLYPNILLNLQIDCFLNNRSPYCIVCQNPVKTSGKQTCSTVCRGLLFKQNLKQHTDKRDNTMLERYGVTNAQHILGNTKKRKETMLAKYGALVSDLTRQKAKDRSPELQIKGRATLKEKYGVDNPGQIAEVIQRKKEHLLVKYGIEHISQRHILPEMLEILHNKEKLTDFFVEKSIREAAIILNVNITTLYNYIKKFEINKVRENSSYEGEIDEWLTSFQISYVRNTRKIISPMELDFFFPELKIAIEFNGLAHHSEFLGKHIRQNKTEFKTYHYTKWRQCQDQDITLISIFEDEWNENKKIVKQTLIRKLKLNTMKAVGARSLKVVKSKNKVTAIKFLDDNHWQGGIRNFQIGYEAYHNEQLVGVMTFSSLKDVYTLTRYCVGDGNYPGLFAKMLRTFTLEYNPSQIITFSDNRYATGNIYQSNGFVCVKELAEGYSITNYVTRWHRSNFQKKLIQRKFNIDIAGKTERQLLQELKFDRIWDCGKKKWVWTNPQK